MKICNALGTLLLGWCLTWSAASFAANEKPLGKDGAEKIVWQLPEVKAWAQAVEKQSKGATHGASMVDGDQPETIAGRQFWSVTCFVDFPDHVRRWHTFMIRTDGKEILADSAASGDYTSLDQWRAKEKPLQGLNHLED
jgi:hypothetical protein